MTSEKAVWGDEEGKFEENTYRKTIEKSRGFNDKQRNMYFY